MPRTKSHHSAAWNAAEIAPVLEPGNDVLVLKRPTLPSLSLLTSKLTPVTFRAVVSARKINRIIDEGMASIGIDDPAMTAESKMILRAFLMTFELSRANFRLEVIDRQSCPKFHVDRVNVRLLRTFVGAGTEYIRTDSPDDLLAASPGSLVFLKGTLNPTYSGEMLHRSPVVEPGGLRINLVTDFP